ncbi:MAG: glutaredoxin family protein [Clostridia bacterium]|nr:glutaredoxin family protein [Clostridiales bacterium]
MQNVTVYTSDTCGYCHMLKEYLRGRQVTYTEKNISTDMDARRELMSKGYMGVPIVLIGNETIVGFDKARLDQIL